MELINQTIENLKTDDCGRKISRKIQTVLEKSKLKYVLITSCDVEQSFLDIQININW